MYIPQGFNHMYGIPLIMEVGSLNTKIGFAGKERPDILAPSVHPSSPSMYRSIAPLARKTNSTSTLPTLKKTVTRKAYSKTVSLKTGKVFKH